MNSTILSGSCWQKAYNQNQSHANLHFKTWSKPYKQKLRWHHFPHQANTNNCDNYLLKNVIGKFCWQEETKHCWIFISQKKLCSYIKIVHAITRWYTNATDAEKPCQKYRSKQKPDPVSAIMMKELPRLSVWHMQLELLHLQKLSNCQEETWR